MRPSSTLSRGLAAILLTLLLATMLPLSTAAQTPAPDSDRRTITVDGTGTVKLDPDTADVSLGVLTQNASLETAQEQNSTATQAIMDALTADGIAAEDIVTSGYWIYPINEYDDNGNLVGVTGYQVNTTLTVTIRDTSIVGQVLDDAVAAGANQVNSISFYVDDTDAAASQARRQAIENAKAKADEMAEAAGVIVVGVYSIEEVSSPDATPVNYDMAESAAAGRGGGPVPVSPGQASVTVRVQVVYQIDQPQG
jgi:uncharacterized protein YggE